MVGRAPRTAEHSVEDGIRDSLRWYNKRDTVIGGNTIE